jgi:hypothetical protein
LTDTSGLGVAVIVLSCLLTLGDVLTAATSFSAVDSNRQASLTGEAVFTAYDGITLIGLLVLPTWIVTSIWLNAARRNAVRLAPQEVRRGPAWCWLGWIVPIVSLWFPKRMVDDVWRATASSLPPGHPDRREPHHQLHQPTGLWWGLWIVYVALGNLSGQLSLRLGDRPDGGVFPALDVTVAIISVVALIFWIRVVRNVSRVQHQLATGPVAPAAGPYPPAF